MSDYAATLHQATANNVLLDQVAARMNIDNDAQLARVLRSSAPVISRIRHGQLMIGATIQLAMLEHCDFTLAQIRRYVPRQAKRP